MILTPEQKKLFERLERAGFRNPQLYCIGEEITLVTQNPSFADVLTVDSDLIDLKIKISEKGENP